MSQTKNKPDALNFQGITAMYPAGGRTHLPGEEAYRIHYSGLDDLSAWEDAPGDSIGLQIWSIGDILALPKEGKPF